MTDSSHSPDAPQPDAAGAMLVRALKKARWITFWERLWPPLAAIATALGLFLAVSWAGAWLWLPPIARAVALFVFLVLTAAATVPLIFVRFPSRADGLRRLDRVAGLAHRPATAIADEMATAKNDPWSVALWRAHVERALLAAKSLKAGRPAPRLDLRDPMALRALVLILVVTTFIAAGGERGRRIAAAFDWQGVVVPANFRLDAWVSPPTYTARPPVILPGLRPGERPQTSVAAVSVPVGSVLVVRASGKVQFDVVTSGGVAEVAADQRPAAPAGTDERRYIVTDRGTAIVRGLSDDDLTFAFNAIPDKPPTIALAKDPEPQARGSLQLSYKMEDDYGVVEAQANFALKDGAASRGRRQAAAVRPARDAAGAAAGPRQERRRPDHQGSERASLGRRRGGDDPHRARRGQQRGHQRAPPVPAAASASSRSRSPAPSSSSGAISPSMPTARDRVLIALDALAIAPEQFTPEMGTYLGLRSLYWNLAQAKTDDDLRDVVQAMWTFANTLEEGIVSDAEARLRNAQEALRQALERGASDEEIKKLTDELRAALNQFLQALAEEMRKNPQMARPLDQNTRQLRSQDLQSMIDRMEQLARSGAKDAAKQLLDQLQQMLENLQMARPGQMDQDGRRRHDVDARRARRHDPQAAAVARQDLPRGPGSAPQPAGPASRANADSAASRANKGSRARKATRTPSTTCRRTSRRCASSSRSCWKR